MHFYIRWTVFLLVLLGVTTVAVGAQGSNAVDNSSDNNIGNTSTGTENKWQVAKEFHHIFAKMKYFFTNGIPIFFKNTIPENVPHVKSFVNKEVESVENEIRDVGNTLEAEIEVIKFKDSCECIRYNCGCCQHLEEPTIHLNSTICANVTYLSEDIGISLTVTVNDYAIFNETVSVRNPPPVCLGMPYVKEWAEACVRFHDIEATRTHLHACTEVEARMKHILIAKYELGCFDIGPITLIANSYVEQQIENEQPSVMIL